MAASSGKMEFQPLRGVCGTCWGNSTMMSSVVGVAVGALVGATLMRSWQLCWEVEAAATTKVQNESSEDEVHAGVRLCECFTDLTHMNSCAVRMHLNSHRHHRNLRRLRYGPDEFGTHTRVVVCENVREYRRAAKQLVTQVDSVLEIGCHTGETTRFISESAGIVLGVDQVLEHIREAESLVLSGTSFAMGDVFDSRFVQKLAALVSPPEGVKPAFSVVFVDISDNPEVATLVRLQDILLAILKPRPALLVFKSQTLKSLLFNCELWVDCPEFWKQ